MPTVSVIIPTYKRAHCIGKAIQSVLEQTYQDFEIIIVDDASADKTEEIVESFDDQRIRYIRHEKNKGPAAARNTGIKSASGNYIAYQDSDDEWLPEKLGRQVRILENSPPEVGVVYTRFLRIKDRRRTYIPPPWIIKKAGDIYDELLKRNFIGTPTTLIKRECLERVGLFDERLPQLEDWEMWIRISKYFCFGYINDTVVISHDMPDSISANQKAEIKARELILQKYYKEIEKNKKALSHHLYSLGDLCYRESEGKEGRTHLLKAMRVYPMTPGCFLSLLGSFLGLNAYDNVLKIKNKMKTIAGLFWV